MRSKATPNDHIDMTNRTMATPLATIPIVFHISIKSTVHPPSRQVYESSYFEAELRFCPEPTMSTRSPEREVDGHRHDDRHRHAVEQGRRVRPLLHRVDRRLIEQGNRPEHLGI